MYDPIINVVAVVFFFIGLVVLVSGFKDIRRRRLLEDIPVSRVGTGAVGSFVKVDARIANHPDSLVPSPICGVPCVFYYLEIAAVIYSHGQPSIFGPHIDKFISLHPFLIEDGSGNYAQVHPKHAKFFLNGPPGELIANEKNMPETLKDAIRLHRKQLNRFKLKPRWWQTISAEDIMFREWSIGPNEAISIFGFAQSGKKAFWKKIRLKTFVEARKKILSKMKFRKTIDHDALDKKAQQLGEMMEKKDGKEETPKNISMVFKKKWGHPFYICHKDEVDFREDLSKSIHQKCMTGSFLIAMPLITISLPFNLFDILDNTGVYITLHVIYFLFYFYHSLKEVEKSL